MIRITCWFARMNVFYAIPYRLLSKKESGFDSTLQDATTTAKCQSLSQTAPTHAPSRIPSPCSNSKSEDPLLSISFLSIRLSNLLPSSFHSFLTCLPPHLLISLPSPPTTPRSSPLTHSLSHTPCSSQHFTNSLPTRLLPTPLNSSIRGCDCCLFSSRFPVECTPYHLPKTKAYRRRYPTLPKRRIIPALFSCYCFTFPHTRIFSPSWTSSCLCILLTRRVLLC